MPRPTPKDAGNADLVFVTKYGHSWAKEKTTITHEMSDILKDAGIQRPGLGFYGLRHTFRTVADNTRDFPAVRLVMGHADASIDDVYREGIDDARLESVAEHVRQWLFGKPPAGTDGDEGTATEATDKPRKLSYPT